MKWERSVHYWGEHEDTDDENFWVKNAMDAAISLWWYEQRRSGEPLKSPTLTLDRDRGVVVLSES